MTPVRGIPKNITTRPAFNGYIVSVGCQKLVFESRESLVAGLSDYLSAPDEVEEFWKQSVAMHPDMLFRGEIREVGTDSPDSPDSESQDTLHEPPPAPLGIPRRG